VDVTLGNYLSFTLTQDFFDRPPRALAMVAAAGMLAAIASCRGDSQAVGSSVETSILPAVAEP
jgi:hypothetical protein